MAKFYKIECIMPARLVGPLMELLEGEGQVCSITGIENEAAKRNQPRGVKRNIGGEKGEDLLLRMIRDAGPRGASVERLKDDFQRNGRARNSVSPCTTHLLKNGLIVKVGDGVYVHSDYIKKPAAIA